MSLVAVAAAAALVWAASGIQSPVPSPGAARQKAIVELHARAARVHPGTAEAARVAAELERIAAAYLAEGQIDRATELLSEALALDEENGLVLAELTLCYLRAADFDAARFYLRRAEGLVSRAPPEIYGVLGEVYFGQHRLEDAVFAWEEFLRLGGSDPALLARLSRARQELAVSRGQRALSFDHFTVFADPAVGEELVRESGADLEASYAEQTALLGRRLEHPQIVVLYAGRAYFSLASVPDWSSGLFDGKIRVSVEPDSTPPGALSAVLAHELAHALIRATAGDRTPAWFHEGLAQWLEGRRIPVSGVRGAVGARPPASATALDRGLTSRLSRLAAAASYAQALSLVEFLVSERGSGAIQCLLARLSEDGGSFGEALLRETGMSEAELFSRWSRWAGL